MEPTDAVKYIWVDAEVMGPTYILGIEATLKAVGIVVDDRKDWSIFPMCQEKRICISFEYYAVPFYVCLFTRI